MALHKIVNGIRIDCTPEEEAAILAEWEANRLESERRAQLRASREAMKKSAQEKLCNLASLSEEEKALLFQ